MPLPPLPPTKNYNDSLCDDDHLSDCLPLPPPVPPTPLPPPQSSPSSHGRATFVTALITAGSVLAFLIICLSLFLCVRHRRRQQRRRREEEAIFGAAMVSEVAVADGFGGGPGLEEGGGGGGVVHHAWHIRTVGLNEAAIESIALTRYRTGSGGASDCAVCLGEFSDGELLRLLPKCAHAFHVACIDTWLRAHVNCPLCRARVLDTDAAAAAVEQGDPPAGADAAGAEQSATEHELVDQQVSGHGELRLQIDQHDSHSTSPEQQHRHPNPLGRSFRRVASMDSPWQIASPEEEAPEDDQAGGEKQRTDGDVHCEVSPGCSDHQKNHRDMRRSLSVGSRWALVSRHCRRSSSLLPL